MSTAHLRFLPHADKIYQAWSKIQETGSLYLNINPPTAQESSQLTFPGHLAVYRSGKLWKSLESWFIVSPTSPGVELFYVKIHDQSTLHFTLLASKLTSPATTMPDSGLSLAEPPICDSSEDSEKANKKKKERVKQEKKEKSKAKEKEKEREKQEKKEKKKEKKSYATSDYAVLSDERPLVGTVMLKNFGGPSGAYDLQMLSTCMDMADATSSNASIQPTHSSRRVSKLQIVKNDKYKVEFTGVVHPKSLYRWRKKDSLLHCEDEAGTIVATWERFDALTRKYGEFTANWVV